MVGAPPAASQASGSKTIVIKLGTSSILSEITHQPKLSVLSSLVETCHALRSSGHRVVLVCSGAIGMGKVRMGFMGQAASTGTSATIPSQKATASAAPALVLGERQALAAMGQLRLIALWDTLFGELGIPVAQVLLTRNDIADRPRFVNARNTLQTLLSPRFNAVPIVNENDTVSVSELRFGDNDTLSAITAGLIDADYLFLLTDVDGLYTGNPRNDPHARRLGVVDNVGKVRKLVNVTSFGSNFGTGGMMTKLIAAELATAAGVATVIVNSSVPSNIVQVVQQGLPATNHGSALNVGAGRAADEDAEDTAHPLMSSISSLDLESERNTIGAPALDNPPHTIFLPVRHPLKSRKWSILHALHPAGMVIVDEGAYDRISRPESGGRLLAAGVVGVEGTWERMQAVRLVVRRKRRSPIVVASSQGSEYQAGYGEAAEPDVYIGPSPQVASISGTALGRQLDSYLRTSTTPSYPRSKAPSRATTPPFVAPKAAGNGRGGMQPDDSDLARAYDDRANAARNGESNVDQSDVEWELLDIGRGLANYNSIECERIKGIKSSQIIDVLGYTESDYIVDEMALYPPSSHTLR